MPLRNKNKIYCEQWQLLYGDKDDGKSTIGATSRDQKPSYSDKTTNASSKRNGEYEINHLGD